MKPNPTTVANAIHATREGLAAAGYFIDVNERDGRIVFAVRADKDACAECLVPRPIFQDILSRELADAGLAVESFELLYPLDDSSDSL